MAAEVGMPLQKYWGHIISACFLDEQDPVSEWRNVTAENEALLKAMLAKPNADKVGEFSLTDKRLSRVLVPMGNTLYDENIGGPFENTHLAVGRYYIDAHIGNISQVSTKTLLELNLTILHVKCILT